MDTVEISEAARNVRRFKHVNWTDSEVFVFPDGTAKVWHTFPDGFKGEWREDYTLAQLEDLVERGEFVEIGRTKPQPIIAGGQGRDTADVRQAAGGFAAGVIVGIGLASVVLSLVVFPLALRRLGL